MPLLKGILMGKKWNDRRNGEKLLHLFTLLLYRDKSWPLKELAKELNCSKPTVLRLIDQLNASLYAYVSFEKVGRESHYTLKTNKNLPAINLNAEGLRQLSICRDFMYHLLPTDSQKALDTALAQASSIAADDGKGPLNIPTRTLEKGSIDYSSYQDIYQTMMEAISKKKVVTTTYKSTLQDTPKIHDFVPMLFSQYHETLRFTGWIVDEKNQALYKKPTVLLLHRIKIATLTTRTSSRLPEPQDFGDTNFGLIDEEPFEAIIRFSPETSLYIQERRWSEGQKIKILEDGSLELTMNSRSSVETFQWLLSFGSKAEVLSPLWLREEMILEAQAVADIYGKK
jgi:predicted DNA-binding transcriptional regulator YafY